LLIALVCAFDPISHWISPTRRSRMVLVWGQDAYSPSCWKRSARI
jgi:hypothetical protein